MLKKLTKNLKNQRGLTLIELLAVVVILGIISAIAVPSIGGIINKTKNDATVAEAVQIINAAKLHTASNPTKVDLDHTDLGQYLDNIKDTGLDYTVKIVKEDSSGNAIDPWEYRLDNHDSISIVKDAISTITTDYVTEDNLLKYSGN
ncbi:type II secretion system protein [Bacillus sp. HMF5848]|uniref:type II secretion system protein n=1 Tax=Bacillus sp. HMF5848 TaxID=2495421 RepID=UPI000F7AC1D6|nr:prepilin-type N-terminal cleavage/methylation domain-containing protein [Bacillus sp. HMF5848]RSK28022.1 type II secretion system protein [Bacillus sp. HMF5848]